MDLLIKVALLCLFRSNGTQIGPRTDSRSLINLPYIQYSQRLQAIEFIGKYGGSSLYMAGTDIDIL